MVRLTSCFAPSFAPSFAAAFTAGLAGWPPGTVGVAGTRTCAQRGEVANATSATAAMERIVGMDGT